MAELMAEIRGHKAPGERLASESASPTQPTAAKMPAEKSDRQMEALRGDVARLADRIDRLPPARDTGTADILPAVRGEVDRLHRSLSGLATKGEVSSVENAVRKLNDHVARAAHSEERIERLATPVTALRSDVKALAETVKQLPVGSMEQAIRSLAGYVAEMKADDRVERLATPVAALRGDVKALTDTVRQFPVGSIEQAIRTLADHVVDFKTDDRFDKLAAPVAELRSEVVALTETVRLLPVVPIEQAIRTLADHVTEFRSDDRFDKLARPVETLSADVKALTETMRQPVKHIEIGVGVLGQKIDALAERGEDPRLLAVMEAQAADTRELLGKANGIDESSAGFEKRLSLISHKLDILTRTQTIDLVDQIESLSIKVDGLVGPLDAQAEITPAIEGLSQKIDVALSLPVHRDFAATIIGRLDSLDAVVARVGTAPEIGAIGDQVQALAERIERIRDADQTAMTLERLHGDLAELTDSLNRSTGGHELGTDISRSLASLERAMGNLAGHVEGLRNETKETAERAARLAIADTLASFPAVTAKQIAPETDTLKAGIEDKAAAPPDRPTLSLEDEISARLAGVSSKRKDAIAAAATETTAAATAQKPSALTPVGAALDPLDVKANFIAAARRAAQAAATEAATGGSSSGHRPRGGTTHPSRFFPLSRLRERLDARRKPLLIGAATIVLAAAIGQISTGFLGVNPEAARFSQPLVPLDGAQAGLPPLATATMSAEASKPANPFLPPPADEADRAGDRTGSVKSLMEGQAADGGARPADETKVAAIEPPSETARKAQDQVPQKLTKIEGVAEFADLPVNITPAGLRTAALAGDPAAVYELGSRIAEGRGTPRDLKLAAKLFEKAAEFGLAPAQYRLAGLYEKGLGLTRDTTLARSWYEKAAAQGNSKAMHNLAVLLAQGVNGKPDYAPAAEWFRRAAELGVRDSQYNLAILLARGLGTQQDLVKSYTWFAVSAAQGDDDSNKKRDDVGSRLEVAELAKAKAAAEIWKPNSLDQAANEVALPTGGWDAAAPGKAGAKDKLAKGPRV